MQDDFNSEIPLIAHKTIKSVAHYAHSHKDVYKIVGTGVLDGPLYANFGREIVFSADLCYNGVGDTNG